MIHPFYVHTVNGNVSHMVDQHCEEFLRQHPSFKGQQALCGQPVDGLLWSTTRYPEYGICPDCQRSYDEPVARVVHRAFRMLRQAWIAGTGAVGATYETREGKVVADRSGESVVIRVYNRGSLEDTVIIDLKPDQDESADWE